MDGTGRIAGSPAAVVVSVGRVGRLHAALDRLLAAAADHGTRGIWYRVGAHDDAPTPLGWRVIDAVPSMAPDETALDYMRRNLPGLVRPLAQLMDDTGTPVLHSIGWPAGLLARALTEEARRPLVTVHSSARDPDSRRYAGNEPASLRRVEAAVTARADQVLARHRDEAEDFVLSGLPRRRLAALPPVASALPTARVPTSTAHVLVAGDRAEACDAAAAEVAAVTGVDPTIVALPAASDPRAWEAFIENAGPLIREADVVVCPDDRDDSGDGALLAMADGAAVVARYEGVPRDLLEDRISGRLVAGYDARGLALAAAELLEDSWTRESYGTAGRDRVASRHLPERAAAVLHRAWDLAARPDTLRTTGLAS
jgi:D-inositol-3-phosphate glycosyltransferase